jgi:hypothetical protein
MSELNEKLEKIKLSKENILNKNFKVMFFMIQPDAACASVIEIYNHVKILRGLGYDSQILTDTDEYVVPEWLDDDLKVLPHISSKVKLFSRRNCFITESLSFTPKKTFSIFNFSALRDTGPEFSPVIIAI